MATETQIQSVLDGILLPGTTRGLVGMNLVKNITVSGAKLDVTLADAALTAEVREQLKEKIQKAAAGVDGIKEINVGFTEAKPKDLNSIGKVIAIMSGKGGVGKSLIASLTATALRRRGYEVGILDADITGPSIPRMFGLGGRPAIGENGILPVPSRSGIEIMSINLLLPSDDDAVIWRGPLIGQAITQFWNEVLWGKLDYLIVDLPPGTADAPLTVLQQLPISGIIIVFTPQDLTAMVVRKAVKMARQMNKSILGVVENMSYLKIPELDKKMEIFGQSQANEMSKSSGAPLLGQLPIDTELVKLCDEGDIERYDSAEFNAFAEKLNGVLVKK